MPPRAWLTMFGGEKFTDGSGRLELAKKIAERTGIARHALRPDLWDAA